MARGDHIYRYDDYFTVIPYTHHGIDCGDGTVIHYTEEGVLRVALHEFSQGEEIHKRHYEHSYSPDIVIWLAESRLGEREYHLVFNNCEHFANWCKTGRGESEQVKPILDIIDILRMEKKERQSYEQRMKKQEDLIKKLSLELEKNEQINKASKASNIIINQSKPQAQRKSKESLEASLITDKFDYRILQALLQEGCWQEADEITFHAMIKIVGRDYYRYFRSTDITNFPRNHLLIIDKLWREYSLNLFGFSVQKEIYSTLGSSLNYQYDVWEKFSETVGWRVNEIPLSYENLCFNLKAPKGHLPNGERIGSEIVGFLGII